MGDGQFVQIHATVIMGASGRLRRLDSIIWPEVAVCEAIAGTPISFET